LQEHGLCIKGTYTPAARYLIVSRVKL
jgi:hypothetical protein